MTVDHYENFPVASLLCPPALRPAIEAIYAFARTADDIADEGDAPPGERLAALAAYRADARRDRRRRAPSARAGRRCSCRWPRRSRAIGCRSPLLDALLDAFVQDVTVHALRRPRRRCSTTAGARPIRSAGCCCICTASTAPTPAPARTRSAPRCSSPTSGRTSGVDTRARPPLRAAGRLPPPRRRSADALLRRPGQRRPCARLVRRRRRLGARADARRRAAGRTRVPGRAGWELRLVVQGGLRILERIDRLGGATLRDAPEARAGPTRRCSLWRAL